MPWASTSRGPLRPRRRRPSWRRPTAIPSTPASGQADGSSWLGYGIGSPVIAGITPDNGVSSSDGITNSPYISLFGSAPSNDVITVYENGTEIGQTIALLNDTWTYSNMATQLSDGVYNFTAMATDPSGFSTPLSYPYRSDHRHARAEPAGLERHLAGHGLRAAPTGSPT